LEAQPAQEAILVKRYFFDDIKALFLNLFRRLDCVGGTHFNTSPAVSAEIGVDGILFFTLGNGFHRAFWQAGTTNDTFISNYVSHCFPPSV
jgi:hypothetical protein